MSRSPRIETRDVPPRAAHALEQAGVSPLMARLLAARGIRNMAEMSDDLAQLLPPSSMLGAQQAAERLVQALLDHERICIVADYDCDGATACAVAVRGLRMLGARDENVVYIVPDRRAHGYGLTPTVVDLALALQPRVLITVDNGIASFEGVAHARAHGLDVIVTDHHLPAMVGDAVRLPDAHVIVDPSQPGCSFESKCIAGVGVMFYVLLATRAALRRRGAYDHAAQPRLDRLLDLVALGTVADVVKLDANNRRLVAQGLKRMRARRMQPGVAALFTVAVREPSRAVAFDLGFAVGPRLNAAGRLADMALGIQCLLTDDADHALLLATQLDAINRSRRDVEADMSQQAAALLLAVHDGADDPPPAVTLFDPSFHEGVIGIVAGRLKDTLHRPTFVFAHSIDGTLKGSGRSIAGFHLRDALDLISKRHPLLLARFGGHAMAAGCSLVDGTPDALALFDGALREVAREWLDESTLIRRLRTDGPLAPSDFDAATIGAINAQVWGQAFEAPVFCDNVEVLGQRVVGEKHLKLRVRHGGEIRDAIWFSHLDSVAQHVRMAYRVTLDEYQGRARVQMVVEAIEASTPAANVRLGTRPVHAASS